MIIKKEKSASKSNKELTIRDLHIGTIVKLHLKNKERGDHGIVNCEIIALFNSHGAAEFNIKKDFVVSNKGLFWYCSVSDIIKVITY